ncbi:hypothetical protein B0H17DRAFT_1140762 [Mycena rosella]|uniref:Uncharacterized protein n=1 Tax=Mycena rosella TaxID=1033263 RepID=A0AAD7D1N0_MYCRO|nr:hypothetical protein B0H17DRAFT_1140762 [Mycena rosella]
MPRLWTMQMQRPTGILTRGISLHLESLHLSATSWSWEEGAKDKTLTSDGEKATRRQSVDQLARDNIQLQTTRTDQLQISAKFRPFNFCSLKSKLDSKISAIFHFRSLGFVPFPEAFWKACAAQMNRCKTESELDSEGSIPRLHYYQI